MVSSCLVLTLLLCFGSVLEAQALFLKAAPRQLTKEEAAFLLDALNEKMKIPENVAKMVACDSQADPDKAGLEAVGPIIHDALTKLGFRDEESPQVFPQVIEIVKQDPLLALKAKAYDTALKAGKTMSLLFQAMVIKEAPAEDFVPLPGSGQADEQDARAEEPTKEATKLAEAQEQGLEAKQGPSQLTKADAAGLLDIVIQACEKPEVKMKLLTAFKMGNPEDAVHSVVVPLIRDHITKHGFSEDQVDEMVDQAFEIAETDPALASKVQVFKSAMGMVLG